MQTKSISPTCSSYPTTADHPSFYLPVSRETDSHQRCAVFFRFPDSSLSMANLNDPLRFRDHQTAVHFPIPNGCSTTALPSVLGQGAYEANHHFPCPTCPSHASEFHQRAGLTDQRHCDYDFQSTGSSSVTKPHAHSATDRCISVPSAVVRWGKSDCSVTVSSTDSQRFPNRSLLDTPLKAITDIHCIPTNECQQVDPVPCVSLKPTSKTSSEVTKTTGTFVASLSKGTIPPCVATSSSSNEMCNPNPTRFVTNDSNPIPVRPHELTSDCTEQKDPDNNTTPKDPLPHWNMRLTNIMHYPKYNTRRNSGFERRLKHTGLILDPKLTLRLLRKVLQPFINNAVNNVIQHYMEEYILLAVQNIRDNLGQSAVTEKDLIRFRRSVIQRVALQYFSKEELMGHDSVESDLCGSQEPKGILEVNQCTVNSTSPQSVQSSVRLRNKRCNDPNRSLHRQIVEHNWNTRLENGLHSSNGCSPSSALSLMASDGPDSPLDNTHPVLNDSKTPLEESTSFSNSVVSSPAISDRLRLASLKVPTVVLNELPTSIPVSSRSTSPHTPSSASSSSTLGYFFDRMSHSEDDDQMEADHRLPLPSSRGTSGHDLPCRGRSKRNSKHANWWHWGSARRGKPKRPRRDPLPVNASQANSTTTATTTTNTVSVRNANLPHSGRQSFWDSNGQSKSARTKFSSTCTTDQKESTMAQNSSDAPRFTLSERTLFTLGSSANTWLGMGAARGRIYTKHPELFRYQCDAEDKAWLVRNGLLASHGVKAYLMHSDQVKYIGLLNGRAPSPSPSIKDKQVDSLPSFTLPAWLVLKVIDIASNHRDFAVEPISAASHGHPTSRILPDGSASITRIDSHGGRNSNGTTEHFCGHDNSGLNINSSSSKCTSVQPYLPQTLSDHSGSSKSNGIRQQLSENSNSEGGQNCRLDYDDDDRVTESRKTSGNHIDHHQWRDLRHKTDMNVPAGASSPDVQSLSCASHGAKSARSRSEFDSRSAEKSPKSPPTLQRFDYT